MYKNFCERRNLKKKIFNLIFFSFSNEKVKKINFFKLIISDYYGDISNWKRQNCLESEKLNKVQFSLKG